MWAADYRIPLADYRLPWLTTGSLVWCYKSLTIMLIYAEMRGTYDRKVAYIFAHFLTV